MLLLCRLESTAFDYTLHLGKDGLAEKINELRAVLRTPVPLLKFILTNMSVTVPFP
jgi:hypothetical protein